MSGIPPVSPDESSCIQNLPFGDYLEGPWECIRDLAFSIADFVKGVFKSLAEFICIPCSCFSSEKISWDSIIEENPEGIRTSSLYARIKRYIEEDNLTALAEVLESDSGVNVFEREESSSLASENNTRLIDEAAKSGSKEVMEALLNHSSFRSSRGDNLINLAIENENEGALEALVHHPSLNTNEPRNDRPILKAIQKENLRLVELLLLDPFINLNEGVYDRRTPLKTAISKGNWEIFNLILNHNGLSIPALDITVANHCIKKEEPRMLEALFEKNIILASSNGQNKLLHCAIETENNELILLCLKHLKDIDFFSSTPITDNSTVFLRIYSVVLFEELSKLNNEEIFKALGAHRQFNLKKATKSALEMSSNEALKFLVTLPDFNAQIKIDNWTALKFAVRAGHFEKLKILLSHPTSAIKPSLLHLALSTYSINRTGPTYKEILKFLIKEAGDEINSLYNQETFLHHFIKRASICSTDDIWDTLLEHPHLKINTKNSRGIPPLHYAVDRDELSFLSRLANHPAIDLYATNMWGQNALDYACAKNNFCSKIYLENYIKTSNRGPQTSQNFYKAPGTTSYGNFSSFYTPTRTQTSAVPLFPEKIPDEPIYKAISSGNLEELKKILDQSPAQATLKDGAGNNLLHHTIYAMSKGKASLDILKYLLSLKRITEVKKVEKGTKTIEVCFLRTANDNSDTPLHLLLKLAKHADFSLKKEEIIAIIEAFAKIPEFSLKEKRRCPEPLIHSAVKTNFFDVELLNALMNCQDFDRFAIDSYGQNALKITKALKLQTAAKILEPYFQDLHRPEENVTDQSPRINQSELKVIKLPGGKNYYEFLGVSKKATPSEITEAYRKLSRKMHPDRGGNEDDCQKLNEVYSVLKDKEKREEYDRSLQPRANLFSSFGGFPFNQGYPF